MLVRLDVENGEVVLVDHSAIFIHKTSYTELHKKTIHIVCVYVHDGVDDFEDKADPSEGRKLSNRMLVHRGEFTTESAAEDCLYCLQKDINNQINPTPPAAEKELVEDMTRDRVLDTLISMNTALTESLKVTQDILEQMRQETDPVELPVDKPVKKARKKKESV